MVEYFFEKFNGKVSKDSIKTIFELVSEINKSVSYKDDIEEIMNQYLSMESLKIESQLKKIEVDNNIRKLKDSQYRLLNKSIINKRENGSLISFLQKKSDKELSKINSLLDIGYEYRIVSDENFINYKNERGKKLGVKTFQIGGKDYNMNQSF